MEIVTTPDSAILPFEITFEAIISGGAPPYSCIWNFGDGASSTLKKTDHIYRETGQYDVWIAIMDSEGNAGSALKRINISADSFIAEDTLFSAYTSTNNVTSVISDIQDDKILWIGTLGGLIRMDSSTGEKSFFIKELHDQNISTLLQSSDGSVWVGTMDGLACYDPKGSQWTHYNTSNSDIPGDIIRAMFKSSNGTIWVGTEGNGLARFDPEVNQWTVFNTSNSYLPGNRINSLLQTSDGAIWVGTGNGLARFEDPAGEWNIYDTLNSNLPGDSVNAIIQSSDGAIWIGTGSGLARFEDPAGEWNIYDTSNSDLPGDWINSLLQTSDGATWIGTGNGLARFDYSTGEWNIYVTANSALPSDWIYSLFQSADGTVWAGTTSGGLVSFDYGTGQWKIHETANSILPPEWINAIIRSSDGAIWAGTGNGLVRYDDKNNQWLLYNTSNSGLSFDRVYSLCQSFDGSIWIGTIDGGLIRFDYENNQWTDYKDQLPVQKIYSIIQTADGVLWLGTNAGLCRFDLINYQLYDSSISQLPSNHVDVVYQTVDGAIWAGTDNGLARFDYSNDQWTIYTSNNLPSDSISSLSQSSDGAIWIGTSGGLTRYDYENDQWDNFNTSNSDLPDDKILSLFAASDGAIWTGTEKGLARFDYEGNQWTIYNSINSDLPGDIILSGLGASNGAVWIGSMGVLCKMEFPKSSRSSGTLVLVAGGGAAKTNTLWPTTKELAASVYRIFISRGFRNTDIFLMSPEKQMDFNGDGFDDHVVDCPPENEDRNLTVEDIRYAITDWAVNNYSPDIPLYVYLIDHGYPDDGEHGPYFLIAPGELLYAQELNEMLNTYEEATGGKTILVNESCYSGQFLDILKKQGRIIISSATDNVVNYSFPGTNSFTHFFLQKLYENDSIQQAFAKGALKLRNSSLTYYQKPLLDDNGDGRNDITDGLLASMINLGGDFYIGALWPEILSINQGAFNGSELSYALTTNTHMKRVWAYVQPPDYTPDMEGEYQKIDLDKFDLYDENEDLVYEGSYKGSFQSGVYYITFYAKDHLGNTAVSIPEPFFAGSSGEGTILGHIDFLLDGYTLSTDDAGVTITLLETGDSVSIDAGGDFTINGVPPGNYTLKVEGPYFDPIMVSSVTVIADQQTEVPKVEAIIRTLEDDGKISLEDVIHFLQVLSGGKL